MKRIQKEASTDSQLATTKKRSTYAYSSYDPTYQLLRLPYNVFTPGRLITIPIPSATGLTYEGYNCESTAPVIGTPASYGTRDDTKLALFPVPGTVDGQIVPAKTGVTYANISIHFTGYFRAPLTGTYVFSIESDDGIQIYLNNTLIVDSTTIVASAGPPIVYQTMKNGTFADDTDSIFLDAGAYYPINGLWANGSGAAKLFITAVKVNGSNIMPTYPFFSCLYTSIPPPPLPPSL